VTAEDATSRDTTAPTCPPLRWADNVDERNEDIGV
jgi:hypothetical protein